MILFGNSLFISSFHHLYIVISFMYLLFVRCLCVSVRLVFIIHNFIFIIILFIIIIRHLCVCVCVCRESLFFSHPTYKKRYIHCHISEKYLKEIINFCQKHIIIGISFHFFIVFLQTLIWRKKQQFKKFFHSINWRIWWQTTTNRFFIDERDIDVEK
mgnify:CR=1 FL=1